MAYTDVLLPPAGRRDTVRYRVLGTIAVRAGDGRWVEIPTAKQRVLMAALLARANEWVSVPRLIDAVWGESPPRSAPGNLKTYIWRLRRLHAAFLGEHRLESRPGSYRLVVGDGELDLQVFEELVAAGRKTLTGGDVTGADRLFTRALSVWHGEPFDGARSVLTETYRVRLWETWREVQTMLVEARLAQGRTHDMITLLHGLVTDQPLHEPWWALLIRALVQADRRADAVNAYQRVCRLLDRELGLAPGATLRAAYQRVIVN